MEIPIISIGNSKGIRLPKTILEQYEMSDTLEMILEEGRIILTPAKKS
ncbi:MAG: AbrB/MazE/SpoVT family DNA-binding domain-containing protein [Saprospiraceae bacterium]